MRENVCIPVIASSGAGKVEHFSEFFAKIDFEAALATGIFHKEEVPIAAVKKHIRGRSRETHYFSVTLTVQNTKALPDGLGGAFVNYISSGNING